jgi:hypothetical protein
VERTRQLCRRAPHYEGAQRLAVHRPPLIGRRFYGVCLRSPHPTRIRARSADWILNRSSPDRLLRYCVRVA